MSRPGRLIIIALLLVLSLSAAACARTIHVVASTSWVGAMAEAAGADEVTVLAPLDLKHPPEYDFKPSDIKRVTDAEYVIWAGYEQFIRKLQTTAPIPDGKLIQVFTDNVPETLKAETRKLAARLGTVERERQWEASFDAAVAEIQAIAREKSLVGKRVVVQKFLAKYAEWMGLTVVGTFGGGEELTPAKIADLLQKRPELVVDNWHNSQGAVIAAEAKVPHVLLINFPGRGGTRTLIDVLRYNAKQLGL